MSFIFGGDTGLSYDQLQTRRKMAEELLKRGQGAAPRTAIGGLNSAAQQIVGALMSKKADEGLTKGREEFNSQFGNILGGGGAWPSMGSSGSAAPNAARNAAMAANGGPTQGAADAMGIRQGLIDRGLPEHIADGFLMNFKDESGLNPGINEQNPIVPGSRGGFGLAQWTGPRRKQLEAFAQQRGTPVSDMNTQLDFLMEELGGTESAAAQKIMAAGTPGEAAAAIVNSFLRPAEEHRARREAQYLGGGRTPMVSAQGRQGPDMQQLMTLAQNPYATDAQRQIVNTLLSQQMQRQDPAYQLDMDLKRAQLEAARNPKPDLTSGQREYQMAQQQGYQGTFMDFRRDLAEAQRAQTNVNVSTGGGSPGLGKLSTDYGYVMNPDGTPRIDPETGLPQAAAVPGSPAAQEASQREEQAGMRQEQAGRAANIVMQDIDRALDQSEGWGTTGAVGGLLDAIGGTAAHDLQNTLRTVQANIGFDRLQQMREASPTGGALGAVSERELTELQAVLGSIQQTQSREQLQRNLTRLKDVYSQILRKASAYPNAADYGFGAQPESDEVPATAPDYLTEQDKDLWEIMTPEERRAILGSY